MRQLRRTNALLIVAALTLALVGCSAPSGGSPLELSPGSGADNGDAPGGGSGDEQDAGGGTTTPDGPVASIDPTAMPEPGTIALALDDPLVYSADADGLLDFKCSLADDRIELNSQQQAGHHAIKAEFTAAERLGGDPGTWVGQFTARDGDQPSVASYGGGGTLAATSIAVDPPWVVIVIEVSFADRAGDADVEQLGFVELRATCTD